MRMRHIVICGLPRSTIFSTFSHKRHDFSKKKKVSAHKIYIFLFSLQLLSETFLTIRRNEHDMIKKVYIGVLVQYAVILSDFNETWIYRQIFKKILKYKISWKSFQWEQSCSVRTDRRTDMTKLIVALRNFAKAPKNTCLCTNDFCRIVSSLSVSCGGKWGVFWRLKIEYIIIFFHCNNRKCEVNIHRIWELGSSGFLRSE
jgi:hypothetical protein